MSKGNEKETRVEIRFPKGGYSRTMFFNRFLVERGEDFYITHFGLVSDAGLIDSYVCVLPKAVVSESEKNLMTYLESIGRPKNQTAPSWRPMLSGQKSDFADIINMARHNEIGEIALSVYSMHAAIRHKTGGSSEPFDAQPIALLRSTIELQRQFVEALYAE